MIDDQRIFMTWRDYKRTDECKTLKKTFQGIENMNVRTALQQLSVLIDLQIEEHLHGSLVTEESKEATKAYIRGMKDIKRLMEPIIKKGTGHAKS